MNKYLAIIFSPIFFPFVLNPCQVLAGSIKEKQAEIGYGCTASGNYSTAMGSLTTASGDFSTAMGYSTTASGFCSTAVGYRTTASGHYSTAMGYRTTASGLHSNVIGIGYSSAYELVNDIEDSFMVGFMSSETDSQPEFFVKDGAVGIGTASPTETLDIRGTTPTARIAAKNAQTSSLQLFEITNDNPYGFEFQYDGVSDKLYLWSRGFSGNEAIRMTFNKDGKVGIGITEPTHLLHVNGIARSTQSTWSISSDERVKENIRPLTGSLEKIKELNPVTFEYIKSYRENNTTLAGRKTGFVAQEVAKVDPTMVHKTTEIVNGYKINDFHLLNTGNLIPMFVNAIQEQQKMIEKQAELTKALLEEKNTLIAKNKTLEQDILKIKKALGIL